jgi:hypothetical protein
VLFDARVPNASIGCDDEEIRRQLRRTLDQACRSFDRESVSLVALSAGRAAVVLSDCDRSAALAASHHAVRSPGASEGAATGAIVEHEIIFSAGVATASVVSRNFEPARLIESAERCLNAARACGISAVKSIEV